MEFVYLEIGLRGGRACNMAQFPSVRQGTPCLFQRALLRLRSFALVLGPTEWI